MNPPPIGYVELSDAYSSQASFFMERMVATNLPVPFGDPPHRHNFQEILIVESGQGQHRIDGQPVAFEAQTIALIGRGQVHLVERGTDLTMWIIRFTDEFLPTGMAGPAWHNYAALFSQVGLRLPLAIPPADQPDLWALLALLDAEYRRPPAFQQEQALRHLLAALIIRIERMHQQRLSADHFERDQYRIFQRFMAMLERDFAQHHDVEHYAETLAIAPIRLSRMLGRIVARSTKHLIDERIVLEARRYLHYTDRSITEIAFALGYSDVAHFSKTFKRVAGLAPQLYREQQVSETALQSQLGSVLLP